MSFDALLESIASFLNDFFREFRIADAVDIVLVSLFIYSALVWFRETASRKIMAGVLLLAVVYFAARAFDLYLTSLVFQTTFAVLLVVLVVVFQEDLRRMFERVAAWGSLRSLRPDASSNGDVDALVEAAFHLAANKTGALIVLAGDESLDRHLDSGVPLNGGASKPLLYSIFDPHSAGHDGAVIVDNDRIVQFGAHLPISKNRREIAGRGTRHSAALGLSECSDALIIVVSEERGTVSVAEAGKLSHMASAADLKNRIDRFRSKRFPETRHMMGTRLVTQHSLLKLLALALAVTAWFTLAYNPNTIQRTFAVAVEYRNLPRHLVLEDGAPTEARVTLSGSERDFRFLEPGTLKISIDLGENMAGLQVVPITRANINLPANLSTYRIEPPVIRLYLRQR